MHSMPYSAIIVGAGIAGLACAISLRKAGFSAIILERSEEAKQAGQALGVPGNASRVLLDLGIDLEKFLPCPWHGLDLVKDDKCILSQKNPTSKVGPSLFAYRADYHDVLKSYATGLEDDAGLPAEIRYGQSVASYDPSNHSVTLSSGETLHADLIVAADGVRSKAIKFVLGEDRPAKFTGDGAIRFTIPTQAILDDPKTAPLLGYSPSLGSANLYIGPDAANQRVLRYPCRKGTLMNFSSYIPPGFNEDDSTNPLETGGMIAKINRTYQGQNKYLTEVIKLVDENEAYFWKYADRDPLTKFVNETTVLVGDAHHPMQPNLGQGASMAIEDAGVLGVVMSDLGSKDEIPSRLKLYQDLRRRRSGEAQVLGRIAMGPEPWLKKEDLRKAQEWMGEGNVPMTTEDTLCYFIDGDAVKEAREAMKAVSH